MLTCLARSGPCDGDSPCSGPPGPLFLLTQLPCQAKVDDLEPVAAGADADNILRFEVEVDDGLAVHELQPLQDLLHILSTAGLCVLEVIIHNALKELPACHAGGGQGAGDPAGVYQPRGEDPPGKPDSALWEHPTSHTSRACRLPVHPMPHASTPPHLQCSLWQSPALSPPPPNLLLHHHHQLSRALEGSEALYEAWVMQQVHELHLVPSCLLLFSRPRPEIFPSPDFASGFFLQPVHCPKFSPGTE